MQIFLFHGFINQQFPELVIANRHCFISRKLISLYRKIEKTTVIFNIAFFLADCSFMNV